MNLYCSMFDRNYLTRGLALHASLLRHRKDSRLVVLCLDETVFDVLTTLAPQNMELVPLSSLEESDPELLRTRSERTAVEYYFTCKPALMRFIAKKYATAQRITYLDSDLFYFSDPGPLELEYAGSAVVLTPHRFPPRLAELDDRGRFNAGWISVSCGEEGRRFIDWWRARCIEWCRWEVLEDRYGDQKYLDRVPMLFSHVTMLDHVGANLAPWNLEGLDIRRTKDGVVVEGKPLVFFHFHGLRRVFYRIYDSGLSLYGVKLSAEARRRIYRPYFSALALAENRLSRLPADLRGSLAADRDTPGLHESLTRAGMARRLVASGNALVGSVDAFCQIMQQPLPTTSRLPLLIRVLRRLRHLLGPTIGALRQYSPRPMALPPAYAAARASPSAPRISIVIPSYNQGRFLRATLDSVLGQNYPNLELIVQDGASSDESAAVLLEYSQRLTHWESQRDKGQAHAINLGFRHATGEILAYLNSDDLLLPGALAYVANYFEREPAVDVVYGHRVTIDESGLEIGRWIMPAHRDEILRWVDFVPQETLFWRREIWEKTGGAMDESFRFALDWDLLLRFLAHGARFSRLPRFLGAFRVHEAQKTSAEMGDTGAREIDQLRRRIHGRRLTRREVSAAVRCYVARSIVMNRLHQLNLLRH